MKRKKKPIYEPTTFKSKYQLNEITVYDLLIGARRTISPFFEDFRKKFKLPTSFRDEIVMSVLKNHAKFYQTTSW